MSRARPTDLVCSQIVVLVTDFVEGAMPVKERTSFEHHLVTCKECMEYVRQVRLTATLAKQTRQSPLLDESKIPEPTKSRLLETFRTFRSG